MARAMGPWPPREAGGPGSHKETSPPWLLQPPLRLVQLRLLVRKQTPSFLPQGASALPPGARTPPPRPIVSWLSGTLPVSYPLDLAPWGHPF